MKEVVTKVQQQPPEPCPVTVCAYQDDWTTVGTITYDNLAYSDSNNITGKLLDINTGNITKQVFLAAKDQL